MTSNNPHLVDVKKLESFTRDVLKKAGVGAEDASAVALCLADANRRGIDSHGVIRLSTYLKRLELGMIAGSTEVETIREYPSTVMLDANNGWGPTAGLRAMDMAVSKARETGVAVAVVRRSNHYGIAAFYALQAVKEDMIGMTLTNATPSIAPWGGKDKHLGTNPICIAVPSGLKWPIVYDGATSMAARGRLLVAQQAGRSIPTEWALTADGETTQDPEAGLAGSLLPMGSYKGYCLSFMVDVLTGVLSGSAFAGAVGDLTDPRGPQDVSHFMAALNISSFMPVEEFKERVHAMAREMKDARLRRGSDEIFLPGEIEFMEQEQRQRHGVPIGDKLWSELKHISERYGVSLDG